MGTGKDKMEQCKFCTELKELIDAHIIPKAFVRNKVKEYGNKNLVEVEKDKSGKEVRSNGYWDNHILCSSCDNVLGSCEKMLIEFLRNSNDINKYNYRKISLAIKGILWKAHITSNQEFKHIGLGKYGDKLYTSLKVSLSQPNSMPSQDFPIWIQRYKNVLGNSHNKNDSIFNMINCGSKGRDPYYGTLYRFDFSGHQIIIRVGGDPLPKTINRFITNDKSNIVEISYRFSSTLEDIYKPKQSMLRAISQITLY